MSSCGGEPPVDEPAEESITPHGSSGLRGHSSEALTGDDGEGEEAPVGNTSEADDYTLFESGPVRPVALSPNKKFLFVVNPPDGRLEILRVGRNHLRHVGSVPVGLEPVAVAARSNKEVWVVNHLSDSVSVVELKLPPYWIPGTRVFGHVTRTLWVGDEPRDIVFAGHDRDKAFITAAHRGQNAPFDPQLTTEGVGRADVWVFDADNLGDPVGGTPQTILQLFTDTPRALAVTPDGERVYAAGFMTGNQTTTIFEETVRDNGGLPAPTVNFEGNQQPSVGLIVRFNGTNWLDEEGRVWDDHVRFSLPDKDVFVLDATADPPVAIPGEGGHFASVGTVLFNMVVNPANGNVYVSNTEANNEIRFEGLGEFLSGFGKQTVRGRMVRNRVTVLGGGQVSPRNLNKHVDFNAPSEPLPNPTNAKSLAIPVDMAVSSDGETLYVAGFGSQKIGVYSTAELENDTFVPSEESQISLSGGGPSGIALNSSGDRLYVYTRFDNAVALVDTDEKKEVRKVYLHSPEPEHVVNGRRFLYDASLSSSNGTQACASCHVFGDFDGLAWDLGDPDGVNVPNNGEFFVPPEPFGVSRDPEPLKGPMATQSLRGLANHGAMHWRGDRLNNSEPTAQPNGGAFDENTAFNKFNGAFVGLNGRTEELTDDEMQAFTDFTLEITYPPNPIRNLDNSLTEEQQAGKDTYFSGVESDNFSDCNTCHVLDRTANAEFGVDKPGFFGTSGKYTFDAEPQILKVPHLRNMYQKVGMFGMTGAPFFLPGDNGFKGDQIRGFGFLHDGATDTIFRFFRAFGFLQNPNNPDGFAPTPEGDVRRRQMEAFVFAFDNNVAPIVGQQVTVTRRNISQARSRVKLLMERGQQNECDVVVKTLFSGFVMNSEGKFQRDRSSRRPLSLNRLLLIARVGFPVTFTCAPPGSGQRMGVDRDGDGTFDGDERRRGSDPADPDSTP